MKDMLTTTSSLIVILFCLSILFLSDNRYSDSEVVQELPNRHNALSADTKHPRASTTMFRRVQSVRVKKGVLIFVTSCEEGLKEHYFLIRDKHVILVKSSTGEMPHNTLKFDDDGHNTLLVTIPHTFDVDLMKEMTAQF
ncbi:hypothetical protein [Gimesia panareensis]|uniref:Uncharacterized protein n=1 Tax=Gimesia panareensis TaxID=2527978 RepID=A0A518AAC0_9PLAN|nr:hypothetical protein [Gimesia panareensis]QDU51679.1 hypothetical protein Pan110_40460 [Gimesia panareensis]QDV19621.1 hypothetical protein Pan153_42870 [Gimesia panareensis]